MLKITELGAIVDLENLKTVYVVTRSTAPPQDILFQHPPPPKQPLDMPLSNAGRPSPY
jgi:hypothetical protein